VESEIAKPLSEVQDKNKDVEIGSYPFFKAGKLGVSIVLRSEDQSKIDDCNSQILKFISKKNIKQINKD
jgi:molybdopterin-biosynthesis enzyme MoeA-like protein